ncbi:MAG: sigma-70 family RNA polymerase sigma factor [Eubacteriales bacterium]|nr:sigma-70 family RNA polymerase sigma factor [Eubacteriales bacterium]
MQAEIVQDLYDRYGELVFRYILGRIRNYTDAEDLRSDVFVKVMANIERYDARKATYSTWIYAITRNTVNDYYRAKGKATVDLDETRLDCVDTHAWEQDLSTLADALQQCTERERDIVILHYYYGYPYAEIADKLKLSGANVRMISFRTTRKLRELLQTV